MNKGFLDKNILDPDITATARCQACNEVVLYEREHCPYCGVKLDREKMRLSARDNFVIDQAISSANTIRTFDPAAWLFLIIALILPFLNGVGSSINFVCIAALGVVGRWFWKHGRWPAPGLEYQAAKKVVRKSFTLWLVVNIVNLGILIASKNLIR